MCTCFSSTPFWRPGPQPGHVLWLGIQLAALAGRYSIHWATPARVLFLLNLKNCFILFFYCLDSSNCKIYPSLIAFLVLCCPHLSLSLFLSRAPSAPLRDLCSHLLLVSSPKEHQKNMSIVPIKIFGLNTVQGECNRVLVWAENQGN